MAIGGRKTPLFSVHPEGNDWNFWKTVKNLRNEFYGMIR
jgi:hypothetical protein